MPPLSDSPFVPLRFLSNPHLQTVAGMSVSNWLGRHLVRLAGSEEVRIPTPDGDVLVGYLHRAVDADAPWALIWHGVAATADRPYMIRVSRKLAAAGINALRMNARAVGASAPLCRSMHHAGRTEDVGTVLAHVRGLGARRVALVGFSLGGQLVLRYAGEQGEALPAEVARVVAVCPPLDLAAVSRHNDRPQNWIYRMFMVRNLIGQYRELARHHPELYPLDAVRAIRTVRGYDDTVVVPRFGFRDCWDYYERTASGPVLDRIRRPTWILSADDDPLMPAVLHQSFFDCNPGALQWVRTPFGGHLGFLTSGAPGDPDRFWMENRVVDALAEALRRDENQAHGACRP